MKMDVMKARFEIREEGKKLWNKADDIIKEMCIEGERICFSLGHTEKDRYYQLGMFNNIKGCDNGRTCGCKEE